MKHDPRIDDYVARQADFARPILETLRGLVHEACPDAEEAVKWSMPSFTYRGKILAVMAAFKAHATFALWRGDQVVGEEDRQRNAMGQFGRLTSPADLPEREKMVELIRQAAALIDAGVMPVRSKAPKAELVVPEELIAALQDHAAARATFEAFPPSCRREYSEWVAEAKRPETRAKRIAQAVEWMAEGKRRHWKYEKC